MNLPGPRSNRNRADAADRRRPRGIHARRLCVESLEGRMLLDASSAGHPPAANDPVGGPAVDAATLDAQLTPSEVDALLKRATAFDTSNSAIISVVDRGGRVLGVRVENGVSTAITGDANKLVYAVDGSLAEARTGAFFANDQAPLTSRTIENLSGSTITQREIESDPSITDPNSTAKGPGYVAPIGIKGHFPAGIPFTPQVDLFQIEGTNRDSIRHPDANGAARTAANDVTLPSRFNVPTVDIPASITGAGLTLTPPESYGFISGLEPEAQSRGIGTLPGGIPIVRTEIVNGVKTPIVVGGIGVFFPGTTGEASEENPNISGTVNDPTKPDLSVDAEAIAAAAVNGSSTRSPVGSQKLQFGPLGGIAPVQNLDLQPFQRIDLVGITLDVLGPHGNQGPTNTIKAIKADNLGHGNPNAGVNLPVSNDTTNHIYGFTTAPLNTALYPNYTANVTNQITAQIDANQTVDTTTNTRGGRIVPDGWLVTPHDGTGLTAQDVENIVANGIARAVNTRAAIRLPIDRSVRMVFSVSDLNGNILGIYRMPDATIFSIDVAVAKSRNVSYYADPTQLQPIDKLPTVPTGAALTNRTFRYLAEPRFPEGIDGFPPGPFSILTDGGTNTLSALNTGNPLPASAFQSVQGYDAFNPGTNFHDPNNPLNQNGIVFFPGSAPLYKVVNGVSTLVGGLGVSGDGVDQDDDVTFSATLGYRPPAAIRADQFKVRDVRLPYQKFNRNPKT